MQIAYSYASFTALIASPILIEKAIQPIERIVKKFKWNTNEDKAPYKTGLERSAIPAPNYLIDDFKRLKAKAGLNGEHSLYLTSKQPDNGLTDGKNVYLGTELAKKFPRYQLNSIMAHEIGHIKSNDASFRYPLIMPLMLAIPLATAVSISSLANATDVLEEIKKIIATTAELGVLYYSLCRFDHQNEFKADAVAVDLTSKGALAKTFERLKETQKLSIIKKALPSFLGTHPPWNKRMKAIQKMDNTDILHNTIC